jgi:hypothetical protein
MKTPFRIRLLSLTVAYVAGCYDITERFTVAPPPIVEVEAGPKPDAANASDAAEAGDAGDGDVDAADADAD